MSTGPNITLGLSQRTRLAMTPSMRQSLNVLRLPAAELADEIRVRADENPFIAVSQPSLRGFTGPAFDPPDEGLSFFAGLCQQIETQRLEPELRKLSMRLAAELRSDGYLDVTLAELSDEFGVPEADLARALAVIQRCEPAGVGARDPSECVALQLRAEGIEEQTARIAAAHLDMLMPPEGGPRLPSLIRRTGLSPEIIRRIIALMPRMKASPVDDSANRTQVRIPDIDVALAQNGAATVTAAAGVLPRLRLMPRVQGGSAELNEARMEASRFIAAVKARNETLVRIVSHIALVQGRFLFSDGAEPMLPLSRAVTAAALGLHASTVGRAIAGKALRIQGRIIALDTFFSTALKSAGGPASGFDVRRRIRALVLAETGKRVLTDEGIRQQLFNEGVDISRRTVAKYRDAMRIAPSHLRRRRQPEGDRISPGHAGGKTCD